MPYKPSDHRKKAETKAFEVEMDDGTVYKLKTPKKIHFMTLASGDPREIFPLAIGDQAKALECLAHPEADQEWIELAIAAWQKHFELGAPGEADASSPS